MASIGRPTPDFRFPLDVARSPRPTVKRRLDCESEFCVNVTSVEYVSRLLPVNQLNGAFASEEKTKSEILVNDDLVKDGNIAEPPAACVCVNCCVACVWRRASDVTSSSFGESPAADCDANIGVMVAWRAFQEARTT